MDNNFNTMNNDTKMGRKTIDQKGDNTKGAFNKYNQTTMKTM